MHTLRLVSETLDDERIQSITLDLFRDIARDTDADPIMPPAQPAEGARGFGTIGMIAFRTIGPEILRHIFDILKIREESTPALAFEWITTDGKTIRIKATDLSESQTNELLDAIISRTRNI